MKSIPVSVLEYVEGGHTLWIHGPDGATVLRLKTIGGAITTQKGRENVRAYVDIMTTGDIEICVPDSKSSDSGQ